MKVASPKTLARAADVC